MRKKMTAADVIKFYIDLEKSGIAIWIDGGWGVDALLTYHYLVAEVMRWSDVAPDTFFDWPIEQQSALIWQK